MTVTSQNGPAATTLFIDEGCLRLPDSDYSYLREITTKFR